MSKLAVVLPLTTMAFMAHAEVAQFTSPNGLRENCYFNLEIPNDVRSPEMRESDRKQEAKLCAIDFYQNEIALCPKTWSTSAGTIVHSLAGRTESRQAYEQKICPLGKDHPSQAKSVAKFKTTMNASGTSGTFSNSSVLYYQLSRYLNTVVNVPVAVMRTMDPKAHYARVTGVPKKPQSAMNAAAWTILGNAEQNPKVYNPVSELYIPDLTQIFGVLLKDKGDRYGVEVNGIRSAWGVPQNMGFQNTVPFRALRNGKDFLTAIQEAPAQADAKVRAATGSPSDFQMLMWMNEISEIAVLDYIMSQQDRIGNIDYVWAWYYRDESGRVQTVNADSSLPRTRMAQVPKPASLNGREAILIQKTWIGDNDAGGKPQYANYTKTTKMLENLRHMNPKTYKRLLELASDLKSEGKFYQMLKQNDLLGATHLKMISENADQAAKILQQNCKQRTLQFDLGLELQGNSLHPVGRSQSVDCGL